jgi:hypothetical protein
MLVLNQLYKIGQRFSPWWPVIYEVLLLNILTLLQEIELETS